MKLFVSYRREDTSGRAGRLVDALVDRFGVRNVFQDVSTVAPGHDFRERVEAAIAASDAVLIVIGTDWLGVDGAVGGRRTDDEDDFVRLEVSMALSLGIPVVPVLVDGAVLPPHDALPDDMSQMLGRQAVTIRDISWHQDVDDLIRRLKGEERSTTPARRWQILTAVGLLILVVVFVLAAVVRNRGEESSEESSEGLPECDLPDDTWLPVELAAAPSGTFLGSGAVPIEVEVLEAKTDGAGNTQVVARLLATNSTDERSGDDTDVHWFYWPDINGLLVDGLHYDASCFGPITGKQNLEPTERVKVWIGFQTAGVPTGVDLSLELDVDTVDIGTSP